VLIFSNLQLSEASDAEIAVDDDQGSELEDEDEDEQASEVDELSAPPTPPPQPRLRIKLKLPAAPSSGTSTPQLAGSQREASRGEHSNALEFLLLANLGIINADIESEDEDEDAEHGSSTTSSGAGPSTKPLTARQAVLASAVDSSHVLRAFFI
jgi:Ino eighty subunit 2